MKKLYILLVVSIVVLSALTTLTVLKIADRGNLGANSKSIQYVDGKYYLDADTGINTSSPAYALDVVGTINADNIYQAGSPFVSSLWTTTNTVDMYYSSGNIGIGTDAPAYGLEVNDDAQIDKLYNISGSLIMGDQTAAETIYVDASNGSDVAGCGLAELTDACATISYGLTQVPKYLNVNYTVSIATGTYTAFIVSGFHGPGNLTIDGITVSTTYHSVQIETATNQYVISILNNSSIIYIKNLEVEQTSTQLGVGIFCSGPASVDIDYVHMKNFTYGLLVRNGCNVDINEFNADDNDYGLYAKGSVILQRNGMSSVINDLYGLYAEASIIYTNGPQPTGATGNEGTSVGGQILP